MAGLQRRGKRGVSARLTPQGKKSPVEKSGRSAVRFARCTGKKKEKKKKTGSSRRSPELVVQKHTCAGRRRKKESPQGGKKKRKGESCRPVCPEPEKLSPEHPRRRKRKSFARGKEKRVCGKNDSDRRGGEKKKKFFDSEKGHSKVRGVDDRARFLTQQYQPVEPLGTRKKGKAYAIPSRERKRRSAFGKSAIILAAKKKGKNGPLRESKEGGKKGRHITPFWS